jgi:arylsulfatase A-like enzyme
MNFIRQYKDNPFFLYLAFYTVHTPIQASNEFIEKYLQKRKELNPDSVPFKKEGEGWTKMIQENADYASMVASMDKNVGRVLKTLEEQGLDENTWIIFTSDNGGLSTLGNKNAPTSNGPLRAGKGWCYEGGIRVPLIVKGPGINKPGTSLDYPAISMDFFTTILNLAGIKHEKNDGENLLPVITNHKEINQRELFWHYPHYHGSAWKPGSALRIGDWKFVTHYETRQSELFNLKNDPGETTDISEKYPAKKIEMKSILLKKLAGTNAKFPQPNPDF